MIKSLIDKIWPYVCIAALLWALWGSHRRTEHFRERSVALEQTIDDMDQEIKRADIRLNDSVTVYQGEVRALKVTRDNLQARYDCLIRASKLKAKDVGSVTEVATITRSVDTVVALVDSFGGIKAGLSDKFVRIDVAVFPDRNTIIDYRIRDSLTILNVQKKHSLLFGLIKWKEHKTVRVINHNPKAEIVGLRTLEVFE